MSRSLLERSAKESESLVDKVDTEISTKRVVPPG